MKRNFTKTIVQTALKTLILPVALLVANLASAQVNLAKGLVAYYPFTGNSNDSSGNGNNPSFNSATLTTDRFGHRYSAYYFDGNSSYIQIPNSSSLRMGTRATISLWVKPASFYNGPCHGNYMVCKGPEGGGALDALFGDNLYDQNNGINGCSAPLDTMHETFYSTLGGYWNSNFIHTNNWYHIVEVADSTTSAIYLNGDLINTNAATLVPFNLPYDLFFGRYFNISSTPYWFNGTLDDIRIYNRALTPNEVTALYTGIIPNDCADKNNSQLIISGTAPDSLFTTAEIDNYSVNGCNPGKLEIDVEAWTNNALGVPLYNTRTLQKFNTKAIPSNAVVNSAKLYYYAKTVGASNALNGQPTYGSNNAVLLQKCTTPWDIKTLSWNNEPSYDATNQVILPQSTNTAEDYVVDITKLAQYWVNKPDSNFGFLLKMQTENNPYNSMIFEAGQSTDTTRNARLEICFTVPSGLPISLKTFTANAITSPYTKIGIATENEVNVASIEIERSYDGVKFNKANSLASKGSAGLNQYTYVDMVNANEAKVYYRLKMINKDGSFKYSQVISIALGKANNQKSLTADVYPNPVRSTDLNLNLYLLKDEAVTIRLYDMSGKLISVQNTQGSKGFSSVSIPFFKGLSAGIYTVSIANSSDVINKKVIKIN